MAPTQAKPSPVGAPPGGPVSGGGPVAPEKAELVKLRYFAGLTTREAAEAIGISTATADRYWAYARAWLQREMEAAGCDPQV